MMLGKACLLVVLLLSLSSLAGGQVVKLEMVKIREGVYAAIRETDPALPSDGNTIIIVNDEDVIVVDTNITPSSARAVLAEIRKLTNKPVRYVVNTHHHSDHLYGNRVYQEAFPQVEFIAHAKMREDFLKVNPAGRQEFIDSSRKTLAGAPERLRTGKKENGETMTERERKAFIDEVEMLKKYVPEIEQAPLIAPTITFEKEFELYRGGRQIKFLYLGRGNTQGDLVVYLPREKVLATGDLLVYPVPFAFDSYIGEWAQTMKRLGEIEADVIIPGHGPVQRNKEYLDLVTALLAAVVEQTRDAVKRGQSLEETKKLIDLESFRLRFTADDRLRNAYFKQGLVPLLVEQAYREAKSEAERK